MSLIVFLIIFVFCPFGIEDPQPEMSFYYRKTKGLLYVMKENLNHPVRSVRSSSKAKMDRL